MPVGRSTPRRSANNKLAACVAAVLAAGTTTMACASPDPNPARQDSPLLTALNAPPRYAVPALPQFGAARTKSAARSASKSATNPITATAPVVTSCADDGGFDTLRHAVTTADPSSTIDLTALPCSTITLQSGAIAVDVSDLTILGPGSGALTIDGQNAGRVFEHNGLGTLTLTGLTVAHGAVTVAAAQAGCIFSQGSVVLNRSVVTSCAVVGQGAAFGGAMVVYGNLDMESSTLSNNTVDAQAGTAGDPTAAGGAAFVFGTITLTNSVVSGNTVQAEIGKATSGGVLSRSLIAKYSTLSGNKAFGSGTAPSVGIGGAVYGFKVLMRGCTLDHNEADAAAAMYVNYADSSSYATIVQSTISSNASKLSFGAVLAKATLAVANSTIAFNTSGSLGGPALAIGSGTAATIDSTIIADNSPLDLDGGGAIGGDHNLVKTHGPNVTLPVGTFTLDPQLGPLQLNGGHTRTHALTPGSPAIDQGYADPALHTDQRGPTYPRIVGGKPDIGAYEVDADHVFGDAFEATPPLS